MGENEQTIALNPIQIQEQYYEQVGDCDWIRYEKCDRNYMLQNMAFALYGAPVLEGELHNVVGDESAHLQGYTSRQKEQIMQVYEKICEQSKYSRNDEDIYMSIILVVCAKPKPLSFYQFEPFDHWHNLHTKTDIIITCSVVFRIRKCEPTIANGKSCRIFIDENARVYQNWDCYLQENTLPQNVLIVPEGGEYRGENIGDEKFAVKLTVIPSPSLGPVSKILDTADKASSVASLGAIGVLGVAAFTPVAPVLLTGAMYATVASGVYGFCRSSLHLQDRRTHDQTISFADAEARGCWINIAASGVGLTYTAAAGVLSKTAAAGSNMTTAGEYIAKSVDVLRNINMLTGGAGIVHGLWHMVSKYHFHGESPTTLELFQLATATLFFYQSMMSNSTAQQIIEEAQAKTINEYRTTLRSNKHRRIFDKISAEARRTEGSLKGNTEVIIGIKNIRNKDQFFADVLRINKDVNAHKMKIALSADGNVNINSQYKYDPSDLAKLDKAGRGNLFTNLEPNTNTTPNVSTKLTKTSVTSFGKTEEKDGLALGGIRPEEFIKIGQFLIHITQTDFTKIATICEQFTIEVHVNIVTICSNLLSKLLPTELAKLKILSPNGNPMVQIMEFVVEYLKRQRPLGDPCLDMDGILKCALAEFFQDGKIKRQTILMLKEMLLRWIDKELDRHTRLYPNKKQIICPHCEGVRFE